MKKMITAILFCLAMSTGILAMEGQKVNINTADQESLVKMIRGVGERRAAAIILYRKEYGDFKSIEDLAKVKGVSTSIIEKNREVLIIE
ncbi:MAG: ComEA family DNA-binding protein [Candidatus Eutrophobiaceae bacterium]